MQFKLPSDNGSQHRLAFLTASPRKPAKKFHFYLKQLKELHLCNSIILGTFIASAVNTHKVMTQNKKPKIAVCFFGITRSLTHTIESINQHILTPAREFGEVEIFAHFFDQKEINNPRSKEKTALAKNEHTLLKPDWLKLEEPNLCLAEHDFESFKVFGDYWKDDFYSMRNLFHQLHSLNSVTQAALKSNADIYLFVRPDLKYHNSFKKIFTRINLNKDFTFIPNWQHWERGYNDRFAICCPNSAKRYGERIKLAKDFCLKHNTPLHSERLLKHCLNDEKITLMGLKASRVRANGIQKKEKFLHYRLQKVKDWRRKVMRRESR